MNDTPQICPPQPTPSSHPSPATLWLIATPIGNLGDLSPRAIQVLNDVALIACEDTRRMTKLINFAGIKARRLAVANEHTEYRIAAEVIETLESGSDVAVVTDAGTPGISDPGERLVRAAIAAGHTVSAVPGPVAAIAALTISGLPTDRFVVEGFLPRKGPDRTERLNELSTERRTVVLYEAPHRIERTVDDLAGACGEHRPVAVCRELTKRFETVVRGSLGSIELGTPRGEYVIVLAGASTPTEDASDGAIEAALRRELDSGSSRRDAVALVSDTLAVPKNRVYDLLHRK